jgi:NDP-sugar pyrophosphorylase family protein
VAHLNYVGDSVLGVGAHLGAGAVLSNLRLDGQSVRIQLPAGPRDTGMRKLGAFLADGAQVGCNAVLQPGTVLGRGAIVWPCLAYGGFLPAGAVAAPAEPPVIAAGKSTRAAGAV